MPSIPEDMLDLVDEDTWGKDLDISDPSNLETKTVNGRIIYLQEYYKQRGYDDIALWEYFREDFEGWTVETFLLADTIVRRELRDYLREYGVYVPKDGAKIAERLYDVLHEEIYHEWTEAEVKHQLSTMKKMYSRWNPLTPEHHVPVISSLRPIQPEQQTQTQQTQQSRPAYPNLAPFQPLHAQEIRAGSQIPERPRNTQPTSPTPAPFQSQHPQFQQRNTQTDPSPTYHTPQSTTQEPPSITKQVTDLMKLYTDDKRYSGEIYDILNTKLLVFYDSCQKVGLQQRYYNQGFSVMLKGRAAIFYYDKLSNRGFTLDTMLASMRQHFETDETRQLYMAEWRETTLPRIIAANPTKGKLDCLQLLFDKLQILQRGLVEVYQTEYSLRDQVISACRGVPECNLALYKPANTYEGVCAELRSAMGTAMRANESQQYTLEAQYDQNWVDRTYGGRGRNQGRGRGNLSRGNFRGNGFRGGGGYSGSPASSQRQKKCFVCDQPGCWSTKHTLEERRQSLARYRQYSSRGNELSSTHIQAFLADYEGVEGWMEDDLDDTGQQLMNLDMEDEEQDQFLTEYGEIDGNRAVAILNDQAVRHAFTRKDDFATPDETIVFFNDRYSADVFQGIMPDSGAAGVSTAGQPQFTALQKLQPDLNIDTSTAGAHKIRFGKGDTTSLGTVQVKTPLGPITFHVVPANTPFLFCINDMDRMGVKLDNLQNVLIQGNLTVPIVRKWGHPWLLLNHPEQSIAWSHMTETELRQIHRRFGHPSVRRLYRILQRAGYEDVSNEAIEHLTKYCHQCQMHSKSPGRFKFTLKDDYNFNYEIVIDVMYIGGKPVLHVVDTATSFQAARFLKDMSARTTWDTLRLCWIDTYQGPPDSIVHDAGTNFASKEFRQYVKTLAIDIKEVPVESHNSIGKVERYHAPLRRAFEIIQSEIQGIDPNFALQMAIKAVNDSAGPDGIVPTLLVFGAYPRMTNDSAPSPSVVQRTEAVRKAMEEVRRIYAERQVRDALAMRNGPDTRPTLNLPLQSDVRVWREKEGWDGPFKLLAVEGETCTIQMHHGPTNFRSTVVKPYYTEGNSGTDNDGGTGGLPAPPHNDDTGEPSGPYFPIQPVVRRGRGRPKGSKNKVRRSEGDHAENDAANQDTAPMTFTNTKEEADRELSVKLRRDGKIITPGAPFEASSKQEIDTLIANGVFRFEKYDKSKHGGTRIFKSRIVNEVKGKATDKPYEKSRLVIQGYQDNGKELILTQSPTIQRASQRVIVALAPSLLQKGMSLWLRDITQAYVQSTTNLNRAVLARLPKEIEHLYHQDTIMVVIKPLYGIAEAGTHWWATYFKHHKINLLMTTSTYDPCLLISTTGEEQFGIVGMQIDDTIILATDRFSDLEEKELHIAKFIAKPKQKLSPENVLIFNGCILAQEQDVLTLRQKEQGKKIRLINTKGSQSQQQYIEQRARGAYIASICQPEATFDLSIAAQHKDPSKDDVATLNKRLLWQMDHLDRGLKYVCLDLSTAKLFVFVDGSFANNKDLSSQIGYEIIIANETTGNDLFTIHGNLIHWSSTKSKRITRSVLASEIYGMVAGVDMAIAIGTTLQMITSQLGMPMIPTIVCTDSYSLYECLVKLGSTKEKRLMIDIMALRQSYERRELFEIRWINGSDNPADAMTKSNANKALETFINCNTITVRIEGWVKRE